MSKAVLSIEGVDGSGKGTVSHLIKKYCEKKNISFRLIGRRKEDSSPLVSEFTEFIQKRSGSLSLHADIMARFAREYQRAELCRESENGVILLDRYIISVASRVRDISGSKKYLSSYLGILSEIKERSDLHATIWVDVDFNRAWERLQRRLKEKGEEPSPKEAKGKDYNKRLHDFMKQDFEEGILTGDKYTIDNNGDISDLEPRVEKLMSELLNKSGI